MLRITVVCTALAVCGLAAAAPGPFTATRLGTLGGTSAHVFGLENRGHAAGSSYTSGGQFHAFVYDGAMHDLRTLGVPTVRPLLSMMLGKWPDTLL